MKNIDNISNFFIILATCFIISMFIANDLKYNITTKKETMELQMKHVKRKEQYNSKIDSINKSLHYISSKINDVDSIILKGTKELEHIKNTK